MLAFPKTVVPATMYCDKVAGLMIAVGPGLGASVAGTSSATAGPGLIAGAVSGSSRSGLLKVLSGRLYWLVVKEDVNESVAFVKPDPTSAPPAGAAFGAGPRGTSIELFGAAATLLTFFCKAPLSSRGLQVQPAPWHEQGVSVAARTEL